MKPHVHEWVTDRVLSSGDEVMICSCGDKRTRRLAWDPGYSYSRRVNIAGPSVPPRLIGDHGGIVSYDPLSQLITTGDGTSITVEAVLDVNPEISRRALMRELERYDSSRVGRITPGEKTIPGTKPTLSDEDLKSIAELADRINVGTQSFAEAMSTLSEAVSAVSGNRESQARRWTSDDALTLILEEIKHAPDPLKAAGEWLTKVTNSISDIVRNLDSDEQE